MNYYFIANNQENNTYINSKKFNKETDIMVVFNDSLFENHNNFKECKTYHFFRANGTEFNGQYLIDNKTCKCIKQFISLGILYDEYYNNDTFCLDDENILKQYNFINGTTKTFPQTGCMSFEYFKSKNIINNDDTIYLVGFTSIYKDGLWHGHSKKLEDEYFLKQMENYNVKYENSHLLAI
jgi:hypothetical protein